MSSQTDVCIVGAGILGLATAYALQQRAPDLRITVLDKEARVSAHQTGHNSGVIHQGIYYKPGSLKAQLSIDGARRMSEFCAAHDIPVERVGKVIVATEPDELPRLDLLFERAQANGVPNVSRLDADELHAVEPHAAGLAALYSPNTAIVDYIRVAETLCGEITARGATVRLGARVIGIAAGATEIVIKTTSDEFSARYLVNCAGLYADRVAQLAGLNPGIQIIPFRGEYYFLKPIAHSLVRGLIYPVVDPQLPFLGVHFTRTIHGQVEAGPNAVFALAREGYKWRQVRLDETWHTAAFPGAWRMARRWWRTGIFEFYRSLFKGAFVRSLQKLVPNIRGQDLERGGAGVRAQAVDSQGALLDDFCFLDSERALHVLNAPSPAATASLAIGDTIAARAAPHIPLPNISP